MGPPAAASSRMLRPARRRPCRAADGSSVVVGWIGFLTAGIWRGCGVPAGSRRASRSMHSSTIERDRAGLAVLRVSGVRSSARPRRIGSFVELCMSVALRPVPGTTAPTSRCPPLSARSPGPARGGHRTQPQVPAVIRPESKPGPGGHRAHLQALAVIRPESEPRTEEREQRPPGTEAGRNRTHGCRAERGPKSPGGG